MLRKPSDRLGLQLLCVFIFFNILLILLLNSIVFLGITQYKKEGLDAGYVKMKFFWLFLTKRCTSTTIPHSTDQWGRAKYNCQSQNSSITLTFEALNQL